MDELGEEENVKEVEAGRAPGPTSSSAFLISNSVDSDENDPETPGRGGTIAELSGEHDLKKEECNHIEEKDGKETPTPQALNDDGYAAPVEVQDLLADIQAEGRQIFVLSEAGKPVYSRHGREEDWVTLMGIIQALMSFVESREDSLKYFRYRDWKWAFLDKSPLILVAATRHSDSQHQLRQQLNFVYYQILSVLTKTQLVKIFEGRKNFDLRRLLNGTEKSLNSLSDLTATDPSLLLGSVRCLPLPSGVREAVGAAMVSSANKVKNLIFAFLIAKNQLVTTVRMKRFRIHPSDLHLLLNLLQCNPSFRNAESWLPLCLPRFDDTGFLHVHISYFAECPHLCLAMLTVDRNAFFTLSEVRAKVEERLKKAKAFQPIRDAIEAKQGVPLSEIGVPDLWHFLYKSRASSQLCVSTYEPPYVSEEERKRLMGQYFVMIDRIFGQEEQQPLRIIFHVGDKEALLGWVTNTFELYAAFSPVVSKQSAISKVDKLMKWLRKEEDRVFICDKNLVLVDSIG